MPRRVYVLVECSRDKALFQALIKRGILSRSLEVSHAGDKERIIREVPHILNVYSFVLLAIDLDRLEPEGLFKLIEERIKGRGVAGKSLAIKRRDGPIFRLMLGDSEKGLAVIPLGIQELSIPGISLEKHEVEDHYLKLFQLKGLLSIPPNLRGKRVTPKELLDKALEEVQQEEGETLEQAKEDELIEASKPIIDVVSLSFEEFKVRS